MFKLGCATKHRELGVYINYKEMILSESKFQTQQIGQFNKENKQIFLLGQG